MREGTGVIQGGVQRARGGTAARLETQLPMAASVQQNSLPQRQALSAKHDPKRNKGKQKEMVPRKSLGRQEAMHFTMDCSFLRGRNCT